jgi:hypothetical protein
MIKTAAKYMNAIFQIEPTPVVKGPSTICFNISDGQTLAIADIPTVLRRSTKNIGLCLKTLIKDNLRK